MKMHIVEQAIFHYRAENILFKMLIKNEKISIKTLEILWLIYWICTKIIKIFPDEFYILRDFNVADTNKYVNIDRINMEYIYLYKIYYLLRICGLDSLSK